jgi:hypothetical protein
MRARLLLVAAVLTTAGVAAAAGRELPGSDDDDRAPLRAGAFAGLTAQRLPIRLTATADGTRLSLDVSWQDRCSRGVERTVRRRGVKVAGDGSFSFRRLHVISGVDGDEERQLLRLHGRARSDGTLTGTWSAQVTQVNGQQVAHGGPGAGLHPCDPVGVAFRIQPRGSTRPPVPRTDRSGNLVVALQDVPARVAAGAGRAWVLGRDPQVVTALDPTTGRPLARRSFPDRFYRFAAGEGAAWLLDDTSGMVLRRIDARSHRAAVAHGERGTRRDPFSLGVTDALAVGAGAVWVIEGDRVLRADPRDGRVTRVIRLPRDPRAGGRPACRPRKHAEVLAVGDAGVWVAATTETCGSSRQRLYSLSRIDPHTNHVVRTIPLRRAYDRLAASRDGIWGTTYLRPALHRIDSRDGRPLAVIPLAGADHGSVRGLAVDGGGVWISQALDDERDGLLLRIDPRTGKRSTILQLEGAPTNVAVGAGRVWVADTRARRLVGVSP